MPGCRGGGEGGAIESFYSDGGRCCTVRAVFSGISILI